MAAERDQEQKCKHMRRQFKLEEWVHPSRDVLWQMCSQSSAVAAQALAKQVLLELEAVTIDYLRNDGAEGYADGDMHTTPKNAMAKALETAYGTNIPAWVYVYQILITLVTIHSSPMYLLQRDQVQHLTSHLTGGSRADPLTGKLHADLVRLRDFMVLLQPAVSAHLKGKRLYEHTQKKKDFHTAMTDADYPNVANIVYLLTRYGATPMCRPRKNKSAKALAMKARDMKELKGLLP